MEFPLRILASRVKRHRGYLLCGLSDSVCLRIMQIEIMLFLNAKFVIVCTQMNSVILRERTFDTKTLKWSFHFIPREIQLLSPDAESIKSHFPIFFPFYLCRSADVTCWRVKLLVLYFVTVGKQRTEPLLSCLSALYNPVASQLVSTATD